VHQVVDRDGALHLRYTFEVKGDGVPELPRVGLTFETQGAFDRVMWYGRGPQENHVDRCTGAPIGLYAGSVHGINHQYIEPQEHGNRTQTRWLELLDERRVGLRVDAVTRAAAFDWSVWPYTQEAIERAMHPFEIARSGNRTVNLDAAQSGVGGDDSWGARPLEHYQLNAPGRWKLDVVLRAQR